jgi:hypothetical protein
VTDGATEDADSGTSATPHYARQHQNFTGAARRPLGYRSRRARPHQAQRHRNHDVDILDDHVETHAEVGSPISLTGSTCREVGRVLIRLMLRCSHHLHYIGRPAGEIQVRRA